MGVLLWGREGERRGMVGMGALFQGRQGGKRRL